ncbi:hypothetical protein IKF43_00005, partial [Candidatus Saccharibacteria bacterium]|nr:hypothetical protein [Candidatus Saccharibacteria bacterium]
MSKKKLHSNKLLLGVLVILLSNLFGYSVFATEGTSTGGGGNSGCNYTFSTCYGATWRWYSTSSDSVSIAGYTDSDKYYARATTITGCKKWHGYWRYAMVAKDNEHSGVNAGDQYGVIGIDGNRSSTFDSEFLGGRMNYIPKNTDKFHNEDWDTVKDIYNELKKIDPSLTEGFGNGSNLAWFCGPRTKDDIKRTLTADGKITGDTSTVVWDNIDSSTVKAGSSASVTVGYWQRHNNIWYEWAYWGSSCPSDGQDGRECTVDSLNSDKTVYAYYKRAYRTLTAYAVTEYRSSDSAHKFLKTNGSVSGWLTSPPSDAYKVSKTVDWGASSDVTVDLVLGTDNSPYKFNTWGDSCPSSSRSGTKCTINPLENNKNVYAYYKLVEPLPCGGGYSSTVCDSTIDINQSKNQDSGYTKNALYMKPGEKVYLKGSFISDYQNKKDMKPQKIKLFSNDNKYLNTPNWSNNNFTGVYTIQTYFNAYRDSSWKNAGSWKNAFSIMSNGESLKDVSGTVGSNDKYGDSNSSDIGTYLAKLGTSRSAKSQTNQTSGTKNTPERIVFSYDGNYDLQANVDIDPKESETVTTYTPYNFENEINGEVLVDGETEASWDRDNPASLAAGEDKTFDFNISTNPIYNSVIGDTYATAVPNAKWKLRYTYNGRTMETDPTSIQDALHNVTNGNLPYLNSEALGLEYDLKTYNAPVVRKKSITINVPDLPAGSTICVKALVWPASSRYPGQEYKNWNHPEGDNQWAESPERCFVIAKKPNFQVWGGGVYSAGNLGTRVSVKGHVAANKDDAMQGLSNYSLIPSNYTVFGSWGELGLVANGTVTGLASGAGTGYGTTTDATTPFASPSRLGGSV